MALIRIVTIAAVFWTLSEVSFQNTHLSTNDIIMFKFLRCSNFESITIKFVLTHQSHKFIPSFENIQIT